MPAHASDRNTHVLTSNDVIQIYDFYNHKSIEFESHFYAIMLMFNSPNEEKQLKYDYEKLKSLTRKKFSTEEHEITCLLCHYVFPVDTLHFPMPLKRGCRVSLQLQFENEKELLIQCFQQRLLLAHVMIMMIYFLIILNTW